MEWKLSRAEVVHLMGRMQAFLEGEQMEFSIDVPVYYNHVERENIIIEPPEPSIDEEEYKKPDPLVIPNGEIHRIATQAYARYRCDPKAETASRLEVDVSDLMRPLIAQCNNQLTFDLLGVIYKVIKQIDIEHPEPDRWIDHVCRKSHDWRMNVILIFCKR